MKLPILITDELENYLTEAKIIIDSCDEISSFDEVVAEMTDEEKRLFSAAVMLKHRSRDPLITVEEKQRLSQYAQLMKEIAWTTIKDSHILWGLDSLHIRKGWKVVVSKSPIGGILKSLLGSLGSDDDDDDDDDE